MSASGEPFQGAFRGARVFVTGHTGFKGAWLCEWLLQLGAEVHGLALAPDTEPALFDQLGLAGRMRHRLGDIREVAATGALAEAVRGAKPDFVFHLAAQSLVRRGYATPAETFETNVMGTVNVLELLRRAGWAATVVCVTSDKCYENHEPSQAFRESDPLGGHDPYSASKAAAEIALAAYRSSFFNAPDSPVRVASARAGNVIGGGDWAADRIVPDCMRALAAGQTLDVRHPAATRPWQHVLEPLSGYLWLAARLRADGAFAEAFNFGPAPEANRTVRALVEEILRHRPGAWRDASDEGAVREASYLSLATAKAAERLNWRPVWDFARSVAETTRWYAEATAANARALTYAQIQSYTRDAIAAGRAWAA
jgi:CDP-glucose 4,6-dehydratase